jgi:hypothetical protein
VKKDSMIINDFSTIHNKVSEFFYKPKGYVHAFGMRKKDFFDLMTTHKIGKHFLKQIDNDYLKNIRDPILNHRNLQARMM